MREGDVKLIATDGFTVTVRDVCLAGPCAAPSTLSTQLNHAEHNNI